MVDHINGNSNITQNKNRPHFFIKELNLYVKYFKDMVEETIIDLNDKQTKIISAFAENLNTGISYYKSIFEEMSDYFVESRNTIQQELHQNQEKLKEIYEEFERSVIPQTSN